MQVSTLNTICRVRELNQSDVARLAGVTRQAVSVWLKSGTGIANVQTRHLVALAQALDVPAQDLLEPLPGLGSEQRARWRSTFLWDRLYPDLDSFLLALVRNEERALGRLVDRVGLYRAAKIAGAAVWRKFPVYRRHLAPVRRKGLERVWHLRQSPASS